MAEPARSPATSASLLWAWRHPRPDGAAGRCIGQTDLSLDPRRARRLAAGIRAAARHHGLPTVVWTSPLRRCRDVGRWLRRWGWTHHVDVRLLEVDFGDWDGRPWADVPIAAIDAWCEDLHGHRPGGGESVEALCARVAAFVADVADRAGPAPVLVVGHAGWINAARWLASARGARATAASWPPAIGYGRLLRLPLPARAR